MGRHKRQTYPGGDKSKRPVVLVGLIDGTHPNAASDKHVGYVLEKIAPHPNDERFAVKIGDLPTLPLREAMVFWNSQQVRLFKKSPAGEAQAVAVDNREHRVKFLFGQELGQLLAAAIDHFNGHMDAGTPEELSSLETHPLESDCNTPILKQFGAVIVLSSAFTALQL